jgi:hypothetical protein
MISLLAKKLSTATVDNPVDKNIQKDIFTNIRLCIFAASV